MSVSAWATPGVIRCELSHTVTPKSEWQDPGQQLNLQVDINIQANAPDAPILLHVILDNLDIAMFSANTGSVVVDNDDEGFPSFINFYYIGHGPDGFIYLRVPETVGSGSFFTVYATLDIPSFGVSLNQQEMICSN
jgi:hypothetical protein